MQFKFIEHKHHSSIGMLDYNKQAFPIDIGSGLRASNKDLVLLSADNCLSWKKEKVGICCLRRRFPEE